MLKPDNREPVEIALDYLNGLIYGGDPMRRESLRKDAEDLAEKWANLVFRDILRQYQSAINSSQA